MNKQAKQLKRYKRRALRAEAELAPQEINLEIAELVYQVKDSYIAKDGMLVIQKADNTVIRVDYCGNWNDLMPLVVEHEIELVTSYHDGWHGYCGKVGTVFLAKNKNPQMALALCLLKVLQEKQRAVADVYDYADNLERPNAKYMDTITPSEEDKKLIRNGGFLAKDEDNEH